MKNWFRTWVLTGIAVVAALVFGDSLPLGKPHRVSANVEPQHVAERLGLLQIPFVPNEGQVDKEVSFYAKTFCGTFSVTRNGEMVFAVEDHRVAGRRGKGEESHHNTTITILKERLLNARLITPEGANKAVTKVNYFIGNDQSKWKTDLPSYEIVSMGTVYENIGLSLKAYGKKVEKVFTVYPGGKVGDIRLSMEGVSLLRVNEQGELEAGTPNWEVGGRKLEGGKEDGLIRFSTPIAFQEINGQRKEVQVAYDVRAGGGPEYGFRVGGYDPKYSLVIDPKLEFSTYLGGNGSDSAWGIAVDNQGNVYITGGTSSSNFPTKNSYQGAFGGGTRDAFVSKLNAAGNGLVYSTYLGGSAEDFGQCIAVDTSGNAYVAGYTSSTDFPTLGPILFT